MFKIFLLLLFPFTSLAQPLITEVWVKRVPLEQNAGPAECLRQRILFVEEPRRFGILSPTDTLALELPPYSPVWIDRLSNDEYIFQLAKDEDNILIMLTPITRTVRKHALIINFSRLKNCELWD
jgi:hypothetical protein